MEAEDICESDVVVIIMIHITKDTGKLIENLHILDHLEGIHNIGRKIITEGNRKEIEMSLMRIDIVIGIKDRKVWSLER